jgi:hypothetical protein
MGYGGTILILRSPHGKIALTILGNKYKQWSFSLYNIPHPPPHFSVTSSLKFKHFPRDIVHNCCCVHLSTTESMIMHPADSWSEFQICICNRLMRRSMQVQDRNEDIWQLRTHTFWLCFMSDSNTKRDTGHSECNKQLQLHAKLYK